MPDGSGHWTEILALVFIVIVAFAIRIPNLGREMTGMHAWKNIRHHQFAEGMLATGNPFVGLANFTQPETYMHWTAKLTEAPLVDWLLVGVFGVVGPSVFALHLTFVIVNILVLVVFFLCMRRHLGSGLALLGSSMLAMTPVHAYFAGHSIGENLLVSAQILLFFFAHRLLTSPLSRRSTVHFLLACALMPLCKITTGLIVATLAYLLFGTIHLWQHREVVGHWLQRKPRLRTLLLAAAFLAPTAGLIGFLLLLNEVLFTGMYPFFQFDYHALMWSRWGWWIGKYLLAGAALAAVTFGVIRVLAAGGSTRVGLTPLEGTSMLFALVWLMEFCLQSRPYRAHEYYSMNLVQPLLILLLVFLLRISTRRSRVLRVIVGLAFAASFLRQIPKANRVLQASFDRESVRVNDRETLRRFFAPRKQADKKYFIIAKTPQWGWFAKVNIALCFDWGNVLHKLRKAPQNQAWLRDLGIVYVVYPTFAIPTSVLEGLRADPVIHSGPEYYKLGLVHRGERYLIFKITDGSPKRRILPGGGLGAGQFDRWVNAGGGFRLDESSSAQTTIASTTGPGRGSLASPPLESDADALLFYMRGLSVPGLRAELRMDGEILYREFPTSPDRMTLHALDLGTTLGRAFRVEIIDSVDDLGAGIAVTAIEEIRYPSIFK